MSKRIECHKGVCFVLPAFESVGTARKVGRFAIFLNVALDRWGVGVQFLEAGLLVQIGPAYLGICHIKRQLRHYDRLEAIERGDAP